MHTLYLHLLQCFRTVTPAETLIASSIHLYSVTLFSSHLFLQPSSFSFFFSLTPSLFSLVVMKMDGVRCPSSPSSMPFPCPKSPPRYPDLSGKRKELAKVQVLEREIGFLEEELKYCEGLQLASRSCKEVDEFVLANPDPLIPISNQKVHRSQRFWKWFCLRISGFPTKPAASATAAATSAAWERYLVRDVAKFHLYHALNARVVSQNVQKFAIASNVKKPVAILVIYFTRHDHVIPSSLE
ncbi:hypothetical protein IFM89_028563 [Coptis chinensis]|uniref:G protein gamma domain-containing protein n=1 Tax=Coptis chinensis TaxID=261450 RepID=A0A835IGG7_9MAGN|nr:hypothetical protein IFM89_028563 [Coptis chinensis]